MVKVLKKEDELETINSDKSRNRSETADPVEQFDSEEPNYLKAKRTKGQRKRRQYHENKVDVKGLTSRQADRKGREAFDRRGQETQNQIGRGARPRRGDTRKSPMRNQGEL